MVLFNPSGGIQEGVGGRGFSFPKNSIAVLKIFRLHTECIDHSILEGLGTLRGGVSRAMSVQSLSGWRAIRQIIEARSIIGVREHFHFGGEGYSP